MSGGQRPPARQVEQEEVTLIPDKKEYRPGDTAEILVQAPFYPAEGLLTLRRSGLVTTERFVMTGPSYTLKIPIKEGYIPNLWAQVDLVGAAPRTDDAGQAKSDLPKRPAFATGELNLAVPPLQRALTRDCGPAGDPAGAGRHDRRGCDGEGRRGQARGGGRAGGRGGGRGGAGADELSDGRSAGDLLQRPG